ncbi:mechanosensitive ion channel domain-containing protein [Aliiglaciecola sp. LCG003]|uniref:mechanosensitive ion channel family protein n=1 Tax=Aliiglaciecola sp. LCG003 TaxID=3053655 RepID=UPI0025739569|nr:mechanosensitive ion channel domain-containing protein [Aliiglaciecola sp. LCG003]WJG10437.1 mechanosensitive ion channel [Aliiglaciecola sp. LCG003]
MDETLQQGSDTIEMITEKSIELGMTYGPKLLLAIVILFLGFWMIGVMLKGVDKALDGAKIDVTLSKFLHSIISVILKLMLIIVFASMIGVETASLIAMLGAAGLAIGLALQGSLANFAGGVLILLFKPFKAGDVIESQGFLGRVKEIQIFNTIILTLDNKRVVIPNSLLSNGCVTNLFCEEKRRVDVTFGISYGDDIKKVKAILREIITADERVLEEPGFEIFVSAHADSSINILTRSWVKSEHYWAVHYDLFEKVKYAFDENDITIPFPQRDVHVFQGK